jgi:hypothetical protein
VPSFSLEIRRQDPPGSFAKHSSYLKKGSKSGKTSAKSPKWSKECLHKRELKARMAKEVVKMVDILHPPHGKNKMNQGRLSVWQRRRSPKTWQGKSLVKRMGSPKSQKETSRRGIIDRSWALPPYPNLKAEKKHNIRSRSQVRQEMRARTSEKQESRWAPPHSWTTRQLNNNVMIQLRDLSRLM